MTNLRRVVLSILLPLCRFWRISDDAFLSNMCPEEDMDAEIELVEAYREKCVEMVATLSQLASSGTPPSPASDTSTSSSKR